MKPTFLFPFTCIIFASSAVCSAGLVVLDLPVSVAGAQNSGALRKTITFKNESTDPVKLLGVTPSCGCMVSDFQKKAYSPGETGELTIIVDSSKVSGKEVKKVLLSTDDADRPLVEVAVNLDIAPLIEASPRRLYWTKSESLSPKKADLQVRNGDFKIVSVSSTVSSVFPQLDVSNSDNHKYSLTVDPSGVKGPTKAILRIETDSETFKYDYISVIVDREVSK